MASTRGSYAFHALTLAIGLVAAACGPPPVSSPAPELSAGNCPGGRIPIQETGFSDYIVQVYRYLPDGTERDTAEQAACLVILKGGQRVYSQHAFALREGSLYEEDDLHPTIHVRMGTSIMGDGQPNLVVAEWTGGAHCCFVFHIFEIGQRFRHLVALDVKHDERPEFVDLDGDGKREVVTRDWTFAYWRTSFSYSPAPVVILRYGDGAYRLAIHLMRGPAPSAVDLRSRARAVQVAAKNLENETRRIFPGSSYKVDQPPPELWKQMLDLIYGGHADAAWNLLEIAWPPGVHGKEMFASELLEELSMSPYWNELQQLNGHQLEEKRRRRPSSR